MATVAERDIKRLKGEKTIASWYLSQYFFFIPSLLDQPSYAMANALYTVYQSLNREKKMRFEVLESIFERLNLI